MIESLPRDNRDGEYDFSSRTIKLLDTSCRDGEQSTGIRHPSLGDKLSMFEMLIQWGTLDAIDVGVPENGGVHLQHAISIARYFPKTEIVCLSRLLESGVRAALELQNKSDRQIEVILFKGSSPSRRYVEGNGWSPEEIVQQMRQCVRFAVKEGLLVNVATEHTTLTEFKVLKDVYKAGLDEGGSRVTLADTSGSVTPKGIKLRMEFFKNEVLPGYDIIDIDWHGHQDRDYATVNTMEALDNGATRAHFTIAGVGERSGNCNYVPLMGNLKLAGDPRRQDLLQVAAIEHFGAAIFGRNLDPYRPFTGENVGYTTSGIHAACMRKTQDLGIEDIDLCYTVAPRRWFGLPVGVKVGPLSGHDSYVMAARRLGIPYSEEWMERVKSVVYFSNAEVPDDDLAKIYQTMKEGETNGHS